MKVWITSLLLLVTLAGQAAPAQLEGRVSRVVDGDSLWLELPAPADFSSNRLGALGVAAGTAVLSGFAIAPALLIGGITLSIQGEKALTQSTEYAMQVDVACEEMEARVALFEALRVRIKEVRTVTTSLNRRAKNSLAGLSSLEFDPELHAEQFQQTALLMRALGEVLSTPLIDSDGFLSEASFEIVERYAA